MNLPREALSVRQPFAWAIIHAGKDIENRTQLAIDKGGMHTGRVAIHAPQGMTREEYDDASRYLLGFGIRCPAPALLVRGAIIGSVNVVDIVRRYPSRWFNGPRGLVLRDPSPCDPVIPAGGDLGFFEWRAGDASIIATPAKWMLAQSAPDLFEARA